MWGHLKRIDLFSTVNDKCVSQVRLGREEINTLKKVKSKRLKLSYIKQHLKSCVIMTNQCSFLSHCIDGLVLWCACEIEFLLGTRRRRPDSCKGRPYGGRYRRWTFSIRPRYRLRLSRRRLSRRRCHRRRFGPFGWQSQQPSSNGSNRQPSKKQNKSRQKPGYVRKEFAEPWLWSEELVK